MKVKAHEVELREGSGESLGKGQSFLAGAIGVAPLLLGVLPFGVICGAVCIDAGMPEWGAAGLSVFVFAGASQLVATQLMAEHSTVVIVVLACLIVNMRMLMYSVSIAPHLRGTSFGFRALLAYLLTDQAYGTAINRFSDSQKAPVDKPMFYFGAGAFMWMSFNMATLAGVYFGSFIPSELGLDFAIPLTFIALVAPRVKDSPSLIAAIVAGVVATLGDRLPYHMGLMLAALLGVVLAFLWERRLGHG